MNNTPFLSVKGITKSFGSLKANNNISLQINKGGIHALLGENGSGKSTFINILSGIYTKDEGVIEVEGNTVNFRSPKDAKASGIGTVFQHFKLVDNMTALENIVLGEKRGFLKGNKESEKAILAICNEYDLDIDLSKRVKDMSIGEKQYLEILKVMYKGAKLLILDEPTTVFTENETIKLFKIMRRLKENNCSVIFISHKMDEVLEISDKITVLRKGEVVETLPTLSTDGKKLAALMVGNEQDLEIKKTDVEKGEVALKVENLSYEKANLNILKDISFDIHRGEVLGVAGIMGSGQVELCDAICGIIKVNKGNISIDGKECTGKNLRELIAENINVAYIPEDRLNKGLIGTKGIAENLMLRGIYKEKTRFINRSKYVSVANDIIKNLEVKTKGVDYPIKNLSGGNIQKILLGRELSENPSVIIMAYPVRGLDIHTCHKIYELIDEAKKNGSAVLFIGEELDVLIKISDRVMVLNQGKSEGILQDEEITKENIGAMMVGVNSKEREGVEVG